MSTAKIAPLPQPSLKELRAELAAKIAFFAGSSERLETAIPGLVLVQRTAPTLPCSATYQPGVVLVVQGSKRVDLGKSSFVYDASRYLLTALDLPVVSQVVEATPARPLLAMSMKIDMSVVRALLSREEVHIPSTAPGNLGMVTGRVTADLLSASNRLLDLLAHPQDIAFLGGLIQQEIVYRLLSGPEGARLRAIATSGDQSHRTSKAVAWIRENYTKPFRIDDLAHIAGMGVSTFHHHFRVLTNMSPLQYQKHLRLQNARGRLIVDGLDATTVAFDVGYESVSQFNREYVRHFGQPPLRDVKALLSSGSSAVDL